MVSFFSSHFVQQKWAPPIFLLCFCLYSRENFFPRFRDIENLVRFAFEKKERKKLVKGKGKGNGADISNFKSQNTWNFFLIILQNLWREH
jgi:hypothetical protein